MSTHTPGPWYVNAAIKEGYTVRAQSSGYAPLAKVIGDKRGTIHQAHANARLMAAAPDLRDALAAMLANCHDVERDPAVIDAVYKARQALALC